MRNHAAGPRNNMTFKSYCLRSASARQQPACAGGTFLKHGARTVRPTGRRMIPGRDGLSGRDEDRKMRSKLVHVLMVTLLYGQGLFGLIAVAAVVAKNPPVFVTEPIAVAAASDAGTALGATAR